MIYCFGGFDEGLSRRCNPHREWQSGHRGFRGGSGIAVSTSRIYCINLVLLTAAGRDVGYPPAAKSTLHLYEYTATYCTIKRITVRAQAARTALLATCSSSAL